MANGEIGEHLDGQTVGSAALRTTPALVGTRNGHGEAGERSHRQSRAVARQSNVEPRTGSRPGPTTAALARADERQRLARDLHDGVQAELLSLMLRLKLAREDRNTPRALAAFAALEGHAAAALVSLREIAYDIYPLPLAKLGLSEALRALAARAPLTVSVAGTTPRTTNEAEAAMYLLLGGDPERRKTRRPLRAGQARPPPPSREARRTHRRRRTGV